MAMRFDTVLSFLRNGDTTHFKRKAWVGCNNFKGHHIFLDTKTNKIMLSYECWGERWTTNPYTPPTKDMFSFDWIIVGGN